MIPPRRMMYDWYSAKKPPSNDIETEGHERRKRSRG